MLAMRWRSVGSAEQSTRRAAIIESMPLAISRQEQIGAPPSLLRRRPWSRKDRDVLESTGAFESQHYELIKGELIDRMGMNPQHRAIVSLIAGWLVPCFRKPSTCHGPDRCEPGGHPHFRARARCLRDVGARGAVLEA